MKNKKSLLGILALLLTVGVVGSLAYFSQDLTKVNEFNTAKYETSIEEIFTPPAQWLPGVEVNKDVAVKNTGNVAVVVKASFKELWGKGDTVLSNTFTDKDGNTQDAAIKTLGEHVVSYKDGMDLKAQEGKWVEFNGTYYFLGAINGNEASPKLLESVTLNPALDLTTEGNPNGANYSEAHYALTVNATTMQATASAVKTWGDNPVVNFIVANYATLKESL